MITRLQRLWERATASSKTRDFHFDRPLVLFQSDDWGRAGVRDLEGWESLQKSGLNLGEKPYDYYTLETAEDVHSLRKLLAKHRDSSCRNPSIVMNFIMANVDANVNANADYNRNPLLRNEEIPLKPLTQGLPGQWSRPDLFDAYRQGIHEGVFFPALHGLTHFCANAVSRELAAGGERGELIRKMWSAQTPYIHWRMPWIGYEYWDAELDPARRFLSLEEQRSRIRRAAEIYREFFGSAPSSACAPGYRANQDTVTAWFDAGIRVAQHGPDGRKAPYLDDHGMLHTFRTIEMEPAIGECSLAGLVQQAETCFASGLPAIVSIHSINFHSTLRDFRTATLALLDEFLTSLEKKRPNLLYLNDADLARIATEGFCLRDDKKIEVGVAAGRTAAAATVKVKT